MVNKIILLLLGSFFLAGSLHAADEIPSIALLEYLADLETSNGEWLDPLEMKNVANNEQTDAYKREQGHE